MAPCEGIEQIGYCPEEKLPSLSPTNRAFWRVFEAALPGLIKQDGFDYNAIALCFNAFAVPKHRRPFYMTRCAAVIEVIRRIRKKKNG